MSFRQQMKGFPYWQMLVVVLIRFSEPISFTSLFPYVYFMVRDFKIAKDPSQISKYTGYLSSSFSLAQFLCCIHWGRLSDRIGRKTVLICGLLGSGSSLLIFGFSQNFYMALLARTTAGALNGNIAVLQTMVGEIVTKRSQQSIAFSTIPLLWNVGCVVGPLIGGSKYLTRPPPEVKGTALGSFYDSFLKSTSLGSFYDSFLTRYPYALSNIVVASCLFTSATIAFLFLEETHYKAKKKYDHGLATGDWIRGKLGFTIPVRPWEVKGATEESAVDDEPSEETPLNEDPVAIYGDNVDDEPITSQGPLGLSRRSSLAITRKYSTAYSLQPVLLNRSAASASEETKDLFKAFTNRNIFTNKVIGTVLGYFMISFHCLVYTEFLPVYLAGGISPDKLKFPWRILGGFGWNTQEIGMLLSSTGFVGCFIIIFIFPFMDRHVRTVDGFRFACAMFPIAYFIVPYTIFTLPEYNAANPAWLQTVSLYIVTAISILGSSLSFPQINILIYRATKPKHRAFVNSSAMSATSLARFLAPLIWGILISYFDEKGVSEVSWLLLGVMGLMTFILSLNLDEYNEDLDTEQEAVV